MTPREHSLHVALLAALLDEVKAALVEARHDAEQAFAPIRADGTPQQLVLLPTGERIGLISIKGAPESVEFDEAAFLAWVTKHMPHQVRDVVEPYAWDSEDVVALVAEHFPNLVKREVRAACRERLIEEMLSSDGKLAHPASPPTGEVTKLGTVHRGKPTGAFSYRPDKNGAAKVAAEWRAGRLKGVEVGPLARVIPLALPAGGGPGAA